MRKFTNVLIGIALLLCFVMPVSATLVNTSYNNQSFGDIISFQNNISGDVINSLDVYISDVYNGKSNPYDVDMIGLKGYWHLDETTGTTVTDSSNNENTGYTRANWTVTPVVGKYNTALYMNVSNHINTSSINASYAVALSNNVTHLTIETYDGGNQPVHPSVYYNASGWNGYEYWMAMTPYTNSDASIENPSIMVSHDGISWVEPDGVTNPIVNAPANPSSHNSDPDLVYLSDTNSLRMYYLNGVNVAYVESSDGISWTSPVDTNVSVKNLSPSIVRKSPSEWYMYTVNSTATPLKAQVRTSSNGRDWSEPVDITGLVAFGMWHIDCTYIPSLDEFWLIPVSTGVYGSNLYFARSSDGITFDLSPALLMTGNLTEGAWDECLYRSCILYDDTTEVVKIWYSARDTYESGAAANWHIGYLEEDYETFNNSLNNEYNGVTIAAWVKMNTTSSTFICGKHAAYALNVKSGMLRPIYYDLNGDAHYGKSVAFPANTWTHVGMVFNGNELKTFINGENVGSIETDYNQVGRNSYNFTLGGISTTKGVGSRMTGTIDDVIIYDRALTDSEFNQLYGISTENMTIQTNTNLTSISCSGSGKYTVPYGASEVISSLIFGSTVSQNGVSILNPNENSMFDAIVSIDIDYPAKNFNASQTSGAYPLTTQFTASSEGTDAYYWDFENDGVIDSTKQNPAHTYGQTGTYSVNLTVHTSEGNVSIVKPDYITVENPAFSEDPLAWFNWVFSYLFGRF